MTLNEMLEEHFGEKPWRAGTQWELDTIKEIFKRWLKEIPLGAVYEHSIIASNMRHDFITMVDEPSDTKTERCGAYSECWEEIGKPEGWLGCLLPKEHEGNHRDMTETINREVDEERAREVKMEQNHD